MAVFYNSVSGDYQTASQSLNPVSEAIFLSDEALLHTGDDWHEYSSVADMNAAVQANGWPAPTTSPATAAGNTAKSAIPGLSGLTEVGHWLAVSVHALTDGQLWRSLGWLLLGVAMMILGVALLLRKSIETTIGTVARGAL
jgi:hypothetical protein